MQLRKRRLIFLLCVLLLFTAPLPAGSLSNYTPTTLHTTSSTIETSFTTSSAITTPPAIVLPELPDWHGGSITSIEDSDILSDLFPLSYPSDTELSTIESDITYFISSVHATIEKDGLVYPHVPLDVLWDYTSIDLTTANYYNAYGTIIAPNGCTFAKGVLQKLVFPLLIEPPLPRPLPITHIFNADVLFRGNMLPLHATEDWQSIIQTWGYSFSSMTGYFQHDTYPEIIYDTQLTMTGLDTSLVDLDTVGEYEVILSLELNDNSKEDFILPEALRQITLPVKISDPTDFDIWIVTTTKDTMALTWVNPIDDISEILYIQSTTPLDEASLATATWQSASDAMAIAGGQVFSIFRDAINLNTHYYFRLKVGEQLSNIVSIMDDGTSIHSLYMGGDRDGGDGGGTPPPIITQPPPDLDVTIDVSIPHVPLPNKPLGPVPFGPTQSIFQPLYLLEFLTQYMPLLLPPTPTDLLTENVISPQTPPLNPFIDPLIPSPSIIEPAPQPMEYFGESKDIISGTRLLKMLELNASATFSKQGIMLTIPKAALLASAITPTDWFTLSIEKLSTTHWRFEALKNETLLNSLEHTVAIIPYKMTNPDHNLVLTDAQGQLLSEGTYEATRSLATFTIHHPGDFYIVEQAPLAPQAPLPPDKSPLAPEETPLPTHSSKLLPLLFILLILGISSLSIWKWRSFK